MVPIRISFELSFIMAFEILRLYLNEFHRKYLGRLQKRVATHKGHIDISFASYYVAIAT